MATAALLANLWSGAEGDRNGWKYLPWFGYFHSEDENQRWILHEDLGWLHATGFSMQSIWLWNAQWG